MTTTAPKFPNIKVQLIGSDGNVFALMGLMIKALQQGGVSFDERAKFINEAYSGDYDAFLLTCMKWVDVF